MKNRKNIIWADDEIDQLKPHIMFLEEKGYNLIPVNSGEDAIEECKKQLIDLILIDEMMTGLDGLSTIAIVKNKWPEIPIIMVTKNEEEWLMEEAIASHIANYLTKPVNPSQVLIACKNILENKSIQDSKVLQNFIKYFNEVSSNFGNINNIDEWYEVYNNICNWSIKLDDIEDKNMLKILDEQKISANYEYSKFILNNYKNWINDKGSNVPILSHNVFDKLLKPKIEEKKKLVFIIIDCLRLDQWKKVSELLYPFYTIKENYKISTIPTATPFARNAIFSGLLPNDLKNEYPDLWKKMFYENKMNHFEGFLFDKLLYKNNYQDKSHKYLKISDFKTGEKLLNKINDYKKLDILNIVVNFVDILGHSRSESKVLTELIPNESAYRDSIFNWFKNSWLFDILKSISNWESTEVVLTSDHGNTVINKPVLVRGDQLTSKGIRYKYGRNLRTDNKNIFKIKNPVDYNLPMFDVNTEYIIAKDYNYFVYKNDYHKFANMYKNTFQHGGITMDEMIVPLINLIPK